MLEGKAAGQSNRRHEVTEAIPPAEPPLRYRLLTGPDDASFCRRVSDALASGYRLYGSPCATFDGQTMIVGQALVWEGQER
jgi:hypothetical protein